MTAQPTFTQIIVRHVSLFLDYGVQKHDSKKSPPPLRKMLRGCFTDVKNCVHIDEELDKD